jgi:prophage regulatory protein
MTRRVLKLHEVEFTTGKMKSSIYAGVRNGTFPAPISLGSRSSGWLSTDIEQWLDERIRISKATKESQ